MLSPKAKLEDNDISTNGFEDLDGLVNRLLLDPSEIKSLLEAILKDKGNLKYIHEKAIRTISERRPELLLAHMDLMLRLANCGNVFIRCGAIISLSNLIPKATSCVALDSFKGYIALIESDSLLIAGNASSNAWKIAKAWPGLEPCITRQLLSIPSRTFLKNGAPSPECGNIMVGSALGCFARYFDVATDKAGIIEFVKNAEANGRPSVARKARVLNRRLHFLLEK